MTDLIAFAEHNSVYGRVVKWDAVFGSAIQFARDTGLVAPDPEIGGRDRTVIVSVIDCGPGNVSRGKMNPCVIRGGDLVVANLFHRTHELCVDGEFESRFDWEHIMAKLNVTEGVVELEPLQAYVVCRPNPAVAQKLMMGDRRILSPYGDAQLSESVDDPVPMHGRAPRTPHRNKTVIEEVVAVGPGAVVDGIWQTPPQSLVGGFIVYDTSTQPVRFMAAGAAYTLVHWRHVLRSFRRPEAVDAEQRAAERADAEEADATGTRVH